MTICLIDLNIKLHLDIYKRYIFTVLASCHARIGLHMFGSICCVFATDTARNDRVIGSGSGKAYRVTGSQICHPVSALHYAQRIALYGDA